MPDKRFELEDDEYFVENFQILGPEAAAPENADDDANQPENWIYPHETLEDAQLRKLTEDILKYDPSLADILSGMASGETSKSELLRKICAWQTSKGGGHHREKRGQPAQPPPNPWLG